ncbi:alpha-ketoglutarate-dependent dioxygenase AlkB [Cognatiluteimonas lumbrici]|uniref:alpha-ketoglutarate-dependent dioxygenase AlkB n=1 Tax=Cognatiluteimonas lumbrici TaxID=2559601 RepID=UPI00112709CC|nr:alpha-ketoglutarate-dependent dioxygenase AlkB [Luteimonas lumbrici]
MAKEFPDDLFDSGPLRLVDDAEGGVWYRPGFVDAGTAARWFAALRGEVAWQAQRRPMYDRVVDVPRLTAAYWLDRPDVPAPLLEAAALLRRDLGEPFNAVGLNLYRDRNDSVAPHGDKLHMLVPGHPVALLSLGAARRMVIRARPPARDVHRLELAPGSLLVMSHASQTSHEHGVPKLREPVGERISLAFRVRPPPR